MFRKRTLFILGAGASHEFELPLGPVLAAKIAQEANVRIEHGSVASSPGADLLQEVISKRPGEANDYLKAFLLIRHGVQLSSSIDDFLDVHASNHQAQRVGKMAIVKSVLRAERDSVLYFDKSNIYNRMSVTKFEHTWIVKFIRMLDRGVAAELKDALFNNVAFIVFNYDRCLEHFLIHALQQLYSLDESSAEKLFANLTIIHPYGKAAPFKARNGQAGIPFGGEHYGLRANYWSLADGIRTYTEEMNDRSELDKVHDEMQQAERIVFLGFAFHDQNMKLLKPTLGLNQKEIFATAMGMSDSDVNLINAQLLSFYSEEARAIMSATNRIHIRPDLTCAALFDSYNKSLPA
jgi:hypothetical protein